MCYIRRGFTLLLPLIFCVSACQPLLMPVPPRPMVTLQEHISGAALAVAVQGDYAYLGFSYELVVLDIADRSNPQWVTSLPLPTNDIALVGNYAYVVGRDGFTVVDITDPTRPQLRSALPTQKTAVGVVVEGDDLYFIEDRRLHQVAVTDPTQPQRKQTMTLPSRAEHVASAAGYLYISSYAGVQLFDLAAAPQLAEVCLIPTVAETSGVVVIDHYLLFASSSTLNVVDLASSTLCQPRAEIPMDGWISDLAVVDTTLYMAGGNHGLRVWDMTDPLAPATIGTYPTGGLALTLTAQDGYLYLVDCNDGLQIFTIADPRHLTAVGSFMALGITRHLVVVGEDAYLTAGTPLQLHQVDLHTPALVHTVINYGATAAIYDLAQVDAQLYLLTAHELRIIDVATPTGPRTVATYAIADPTHQNLWHIAATLTHAYLGDTAGNVWLVDLAAPAQPLIEPRYYALGHVGAMALADGYAYLPATAGGMRVLAVAATGELTERSLYPTPEQINKIALVDGYAYLAGAHGLVIVDVHASRAHPGSPYTHRVSDL